MLTSDPNALTDVKHYVDSKNVTFSWARPSGRIDYYIVVYNPVRDPLAHNSHQFPANRTLVGEPVSVAIENLKPGELYSFRLYSVRYLLLMRYLFQVQCFHKYILLYENIKKKYRCKYTDSNDALYTSIPILSDIVCRRLLN